MSEWIRETLLNEARESHDRAMYRTHFHGAGGYLVALDKHHRAGCSGREDDGGASGHCAQESPVNKS
jgi:hypothetical protein